ncbi:unnamed protein product [Heligmosomoides polygyrus]|uniref:Uncharacterized protein n=1 Tax=Heligmosomoides polygyrus TaxID=6339 RepID=A0A183GH59_HELPZ|nr:unnamed protein product [Heligmosomoides polygyrus]
MVGPRFRGTRKASERSPKESPKVIKRDLAEVGATPDDSLDRMRSSRHDSEREGWTKEERDMWSLDEEVLGLKERIRTFSRMGLGEAERDSGFH